MGKLRDAPRTRKRIIDAATTEFSEHGYDGARIEEIAHRARVSKQLILHHFRSKEALFKEVHAINLRPSDAWVEQLPEDAADIIAERFRRRARDVAYIRFLTWEAATANNRPLPSEEVRQRRVTRYGNALRLLQVDGLLPADLDYKLMQLTILALATYPMAFNQITRLVTGHSGTDPAFQREWIKYLRKIGAKLFANGKQQNSARRRTARR